jgi:type VI secretion system secreted protein Hcp
MAVAVDYFLKIDGIEGESQDSKHKNEIQVLSFHFGGTNPCSIGVGTGHNPSKVHMEDVHFEMPVNKASPKLLLACANGEHIKTALLTCRKAGKEQQEYLKFKFEDLFVSSYNISGKPGADNLPTDTFSLNFGKFSVDYKTQDAKGMLSGGAKIDYDLTKMKST